MTELELIEEMCAVVPAPDASRLATVRARVLDEALRPAAPPRRRLRPDTRPDTRRAPRPRLRRRGWPRLGLTLTGAVAAAVAIILAVTGVISFGGGPLAPPASAAVLLNRAATAALGQPVPTDRQLIYSDTTIYYTTYARQGGGKPSGHLVVRQEEWQSPASPHAFYRTSPCDMDGDLMGGQGPCNSEGDYAPGAQRYSTYAGLRTLPVSAGKLLGYLATLPAPDGLGRADRQWSGANLIAQLNPVLPPGFGAALFRALAQIPGMTLLPSTADAAGARGIGLAKTVAGMREELIFDPASYQLIGQQSVALAHRGSAGYVTAATALRHHSFVATGPGSDTSGPVPGAGAAPGAGQFIYTDTRIVGLYPSVRAGRAPRFTAFRGSEQMWQSVNGAKPGALRSSPCPDGSGCLLLIPPGAASPALPSYQGLTALPRDPGELASYLRQHAGCARGPAGQWGAVAAILGNEQVLPPGLGRALFQTAAAIPGATVLPRVTDAAGGRGLAVARNESPALRQELIFTPGSYRFIGVQEILIRPLGSLRAGTVWVASSLADARIVNTAPVASLSQSYLPQSCGYTPGTIAIGSSGSPSSSAPAASAQASSAPAASPRASSAPAAPAASASSQTPSP